MAARVANPSHHGGQDSELRRNYELPRRVGGVGMICVMANVISSDEISSDEAKRLNPAGGTQAHGPWNPGIQSQMPRELCHLSTIFRPENVFTSIAAVTDLQGLTGFSTLALGSILAFLAIVAGSALTMKFQYWRMTREG